MTRRADQLPLSLGFDAELAASRRAALRELATSVQAIGRNGVPSISELVVRLADAFEYEPERTADLVNEIFIVAAESHVVAAEELQDGKC